MNQDTNAAKVPRNQPPLDPDFQPAVLAIDAFEDKARETGDAVPVRIAVEQADGTINTLETVVFPGTHAGAVGNLRHIERLAKFLLWSRGGHRVYLSGSEALSSELRSHYEQNITGIFDAEIMGTKIYDRPFEVVPVSGSEAPAARSATAPLGRHLKGCRIGFDLGASDRKAAAVIDGEVVFSEEKVWDPVPVNDPQWHFDQIMDSLRSAASHLPRVDAIGGSSAGVLVNNQVRLASIFRGVPEQLFKDRVTPIFLEIRKAWNDIPFDIVNDGEVTALAGSMALNENGVLGIAMGSSQAAGYVNPEGNITSWLNELAFAPVDYHPEAALDEWSRDRGCGVQYFSQQAVGKLIPRAGIEVEPDTPLPEQLKHVQALMNEGDQRARQIYESIGSYLGYTLAHYSRFYEFGKVLILGRVTSGPGCDIIIEQAQRVLAIEFPELAAKIGFHIPDEKEKRHGQAIAAASLPGID